MILLGLDVGQKRIGVAKANSITRVAHPLSTIAVDQTEREQIKQLVEANQAEKIIVGLPRNQAGEVTKQTRSVQQFVEDLKSHVSIKVEFQDESLTSVEATKRLEEASRPYSKGDVDMEAAAIILQDYMNEKV